MILLQSFETSSAAFPFQPLHLLEEISHRVANEYAEAIAMLRLAAAANAGNAQVGTALGNVPNRVSIGEAGGWVSCGVSDNGRLIYAAEPGRGRRLVEALAAELGGPVDWWFTPAGCLARLEIPTTVAPVR